MNWYAGYGRGMTDGSESTVVSPERAAVLIPGGNYSTDAPLLNFTREAVDVREAYVEAIHWTPPDLEQAAFRNWLNGSESQSWVCGQVSDALERVAKQAPVAHTVLVGKSLGSRAVQVAADRDLPAIWFTPLLYLADVAAALRRCTAPFLLLGGTADESWDGSLARDLTPHVVELPGADHGLMLPGPLAATFAAQSVALTAVEAFLDEVVWP